MWTILVIRTFLKIKRYKGVRITEALLYWLNNQFSCALANVCAMIPKLILILIHLYGYHIIIMSWCVPLVICEEFLKYMDGFKPFLLVGLKNRAEYQVCHAAVGLVGDLARSLQGQIAPYTKDIMEVLFEDLTVSVVLVTEQYHLITHRTPHYIDQ